MKRLPVVLTLLALAALAASLAYWALQLVRPPQRPLAAPPTAQLAEPAIDAAATLFGGQAAAAVATDYQLSGVVAGGAGSVAIVTATGQPPKAVAVGKEVMPGVTVAEVHPRYVMLSEGGVMKRVDLPAESRASASAAAPGVPAAGMPPGGEPPVAPGPVRGAAEPEAGRGDVAPHDAPAAPVQMPPPVRSPAPPTPGTR